MRRQIPHLHVLGHPLSKNGHVKLLCDTKALQAAPPRCRKRTSSGISEDQIMGTEAATSHYREAVKSDRHYVPSRPMSRSVTALCDFSRKMQLTGPTGHA